MYVVCYFVGFVSFLINNVVVQWDFFIQFVHWVFVDVDVCYDKINVVECYFRIGGVIKCNVWCFFFKDDFIGFGNYFLLCIIVIIKFQCMKWEMVLICQEY